jgi:hypothetical protein
LIAVARFVQSKDTNEGIDQDEKKAGFEMKWERDEKIDAKVKNISSLFKGDGGELKNKEVFSIWKFTDKTRIASLGTKKSFSKMSDAYNFFT